MGVLLDEGGLPLLDEGGQLLHDEGGPGFTDPDTPDPFKPPPGPRLTVGFGPAGGLAPTQQLTAWSGLTIKDNLFTGPEFSVTIPANSPAAVGLHSLSTDGWVYRRSPSPGIDGPRWMRCRVLPTTQAWGEDGTDDITVTAAGYKRVVEARHIIARGPTFPAQVPDFLQVDEGQIVWMLVQHTQAQPGGNLGITPGEYLTGVPRDRTEYKVGDDFATVLNALGQIETGCWWGIDAAKWLQVRLWQDFPTRTEPIVRGQNARALARTPGLMYANVAGSVGSTEHTVPYWELDETALTDPRGRWEAFDTEHTTVELQETTIAYARGMLEQRLNPPANWTATLEPAAYFEGSSNYDVGDFVPIVVPQTVADVSAPPSVTVRAQVTEIAVTYSDSGEATVGLSAREVL